MQSFQPVYDNLVFYECHERDAPHLKTLGQRLVAVQIDSIYIYAVFCLDSDLLQNRLQLFAGQTPVGKKNRSTAIGRRLR